MVIGGSTVPTTRQLYLVVGIAILVLLAAGIYHLSTFKTSRVEVLRVYVYDSFMAWGEDPELFDNLVSSFEEKSGVEVEVIKFDSARAMITTLISEVRAGKETAHVVIGVDAVTLVELSKHGVIECYLAPGVDERLVESLDPSRCITPIDYGLIALVYDPSRLDKDTIEMLSDGVTLEELVEISEITVGEDATISSTGLNFLLYTIAASKREGRAWQDLWRDMVENGFYIAGSWSDAYEEFFKEGSRRAVVVSYGADPAYSAWYSSSKGGEEKPSIKATVLVVGGEKAGWLQIEGVAIIRGAPLREAREFVNWLVSEEVQKHIPSSQWMFPANPRVELPSYYRFALGIDDVEYLLNKEISISDVSKNLEDWLSSWTKIVS